ncbi:MAG: RecQ family ATP-dependent DNA helicase [Sphingobacteriales bacterium]|nr:RecQ family ATP-dependent DNA helicase [Sphingobacteriales bacterium]
MTIHQILETHWGHTAFRPLQEDIIQSVLLGNDTLALLPTGGGKSICFQVPALALEGMCIVISPLIALMKDQVFNLKRHNITAEAIFTGMSRLETERILNNCVQKKVKFLYISPERLQTAAFREQLLRMKVSLIAIDEAHCISQWGYDFRPSYLKIADIRQLLPKVSLLALTATATERVKEDIQEKLQFEKNAQVFQQSFKRANLSYSVFKTDNKLGKMLDIFKKVAGTGIVYVRSRRKAKDTAEFLSNNGIKSDFYHAGLDPKTRSRKQDEWIKNKTRVMVCTNAFGMGIDKPDVRTVVHIDLTESLEAYYQEAGRGGRDGKKAYAVALYDDADIKSLEQSSTLKFPEIDLLKQVYGAIGNYCKVATEAGEGQSFVFDISEFCKSYKLKALDVANSLAVLQQNDYLIANDALQEGSKLLFTTSHEEIYRLQVANRRLEPYIKTILRTYGGVYDDYVVIRETDIARNMNVPAEHVKNALLYLQKTGAADYQPALNEPSITFLQARVATDRLFIDTQLLAFRKQIHEQNVNSVISYVTNPHLCRTLQLVRYFNELNTEPCGVCDVCLAQKKQAQTEEELTQVLQQQITETVNAEKMTVEHLVRRLGKYKQDDALKVIRWMLENEQLQLDEQKRVVLGG